MIASVQVSDAYAFGIEDSVSEGGGYVLSTSHIPGDFHTTGDRVVTDPDGNDPWVLPTSGYWLDHEALQALTDLVEVLPDALKEAADAGSSTEARG